MIATADTAQRISDLSADEYARRLRAGLGVRFGPFAAKICTAHDPLFAPISMLYADYPTISDSEVFSFHVRLDKLRGLYRLGKSKVRFSVDGRAAHEDMPVEHALPVLEWGINLVIALRFHSYLILHAGVVERDGCAMLLPAAPGAGKSTLCAGLSLGGWRLFSDEFGLLRPGTIDLIPMPRPIALKNESIPLIREYSSNAVIGPETSNTRKGTVAHLKPPAGSVARYSETAPVKWIVFPRWQPGVASTLTEIPKAEAFMFLATNAFNYEMLGEAAFQTVKNLIERARCFHFDYSDLENAVAALTDFVGHDED